MYMFDTTDMAASWVLPSHPLMIVNSSYLHENNTTWLVYCGRQEATKRNALTQTLRKTG
jgi:hypothetical protein